MENQIVQFDGVGTTYRAIEYNEAWTVMDEEEYRREICERLDLDFSDIQIDSDGIPF
ncbi:hypothetical protein GIV96_26730 [Pseudomonas syringae]|uniref:hypothetical protein n=1 Tax=Pseudomonas syringae group TaxID=136849 RepID=UPI0012B9F2A0|nr:MULTISPECIES: hypothetical protein [Pseudomonas syringae group]MCF5396841.1 hypothetical protein [Pseudomonas syringae]MCF5403555.1 hypothetical protein [Pseudomonas syringae]